MEREHPELCEWGDMPLGMVLEIANQTPAGTVVQFHNNGEPTLYPHLGEAMFCFEHCIRQFNTNGKLLIEKAHEIIGNLDVLTISVIENDPEGGEQYERVQKFLALKGDERSPRLVYRLLGKVDNTSKWEVLSGQIAKRVLHSPEGSKNYQRKVTIPETGICLELLTHLAIDRYGNISICVRFDPEGHLRLGNINEMTLEEAWNGEKRRKYVENHVKGRRDLCPGCDKCEFWGVPTGQ
jgi:radical SAM protein with 4Fe4S-binding SPASM domain